MIQNNTNIKTLIAEKVIYPNLSYSTVGILMSVHNELGPYAREKQYGDRFEEKLIQEKIKHKRELRTENPLNLIDFIVENEREGPILVELKTRRILTRDDYFQIQRYLQETGIKLGLLVNFRNKYIKPVRIIKIDKYAQDFLFA